MVQLYTILIRVFGLGISVAALFNAKARQWKAGRKGLFASLAEARTSHQHWIWMHVSSLGEFEQGRPLLEVFRKAHPEHGLLLTFFSPSGYLIRKDFRGVDFVTYMPLDTPENAARFIELVKPVVAVFVKYDIWYHHLHQLEQQRIPTFLISANLRAGQIYFKSWGGFIRERLRHLTHIYTQTPESARMLVDAGFQNVSQAGDTRLDRVLDIAAASHDLTVLKDNLPEGAVLIAGSTWPEDESRLLPVIKELDIACVIAPHEISEDRMRDIERQIPGAIRLSDLRNQPRPVQYLIVDTMGELAFLYALGTIAYVGGGFGKGIHNILEPIAHRLPVLIGPKHEKFVEAVVLNQAGVVEVVTTPDEVRRAIHTFEDYDRRAEVENAISTYIEMNKGATRKIYEGIRQHL
jgi:3-deoxy-D-manno-octulosonic-acid transferase